MVIYAHTANTASPISALNKSVNELENNTWFSSVLPCMSNTASKCGIYMTFVS